jgi:hypothetical protein
MKSPASTYEGPMNNDKKKYPPRNLSSIVLIYLILRMHREDPDRNESEMPLEAVEQMIRDTIDELLDKLSSDKPFNGLPPEKRLEGLSAKKLLETFSPEELRAVTEEAQLRLQEKGPSPKSPGSEEL